VVGWPIPPDHSVARCAGSARWLMCWAIHAMLGKFRGMEIEARTDWVAIWTLPLPGSTPGGGRRSAAEYQWPVAGRPMIPNRPLTARAGRFQPSRAIGKQQRLMVARSHSWPPFLIARASDQQNAAPCPVPRPGILCTTPSFPGIP
jgi:hypothetical protein